MIEFIGSIILFVMSVAVVVGLVDLIIMLVLLFVDRK